MKNRYLLLPFCLVGCASNSALPTYVGDRNSVKATGKDYSIYKRQAYKLIEPKYIKYTTGMRLIEDPNNLRERRDIILKLTDLCMNKAGYANKN